MKPFNVVLVATLLLAIGCHAPAPAKAPTWKETVARVHDEEYENALSGVAWSVMHTSSSDDGRVLLELLSKLAEAVQKDQPELLAPLGGLDGSKKRLLALLESSDDTVSGSAAVILGALGDRSVIPAIARSRNPSPS